MNVENELCLNYIDRIINGPGGIYTAHQMAHRHTAITVNGIYGIHFNKDKNGADKFGVFAKIGRKLVIDEIAFFRWVKSQQV